MASFQPRNVAITWGRMLSFDLIIPNDSMIIHPNPIQSRQFFVFSMCLVPKKQGTRFALLCSGKVCLSVQRDKVNRANLVKGRANAVLPVLVSLPIYHQMPPVEGGKKSKHNHSIIDSPKIIMKRPLLRCSVWFAHPSSAALKLYHMLARPAQLPEGICQRWLYLTAQANLQVDNMLEVSPKGYLVQFIFWKTLELHQKHNIS